MDIKVDTNTALIFDLDDTLYNELDFLKSAYRQIAKELDSNDWIALYASMISMYRCNVDVFDALALKYDVPKKKLVTTYRDHLPQIQLFDDVPPLLHKIKLKKGKIGMVTDGRSRTQRHKIKALGLTNVIDYTVISEEIGTEKPAENNFKKIEEALGSSTYYYIADNFKKDFITPNTLGWKTVGRIDNGMNIHHNSYKYMDIGQRPHDFVTSFAEINIL